MSKHLSDCIIPIIINRVISRKFSVNIEKPEREGGRGGGGVNNVFS